MELTAKDKAELLRFKTGFPWMEIVAPATPARGIKVLSKNEVSKAVETAEKALSRAECKCACNGLKFAKFVPASGAASRMFKDLLNKNVIATNKFVSNINKFAFYDKSIYADINGEALVDFTLGKGGLDYASKPKGVLKFHRYEDEVRTAIAEHLVEAARYMKNSEGQADLVITISPEHQTLFDEAISEVKSKYENKYGVSYNIKTVFQYKWTDTIAVTPEGEPFLTDDGTVLHRPGGHGALIHNLNEVDADVVSIKNIDNVSVESYLPMTAKWKRVLIGTALLYRKEINNFIKRLNTSASNDLCDEIESFLKDELCIELPTSYSAATVEEKVKILYSYLHRPIRVCGMVKNEGEPGGGPFLVREKDGGTSLQILEGVQINQNDARAVECLKSSTHFNPVDLVCVLTDENGRHFDLLEYVDEDAGFISSKSYQGRDLRALELPGLWNGSMSRWNTVFVEVPVETFNPVKTVLDLLRPAHQAR